MQRLKVCRKLMAFVLTLCMVLPLISNQYLVVRAEEEKGETTNKSYLEADVLTTGENKLKWVDGEIVTYTDSSYKTEKWTGKVVHITVPEDEMYTLKFLYDNSASSESEVNLRLNIYRLYGAWMNLYTSFDMSLSAKNTMNYCYLPSGDYWLEMVGERSVYPKKNSWSNLLHN